MRIYKCVTEKELEYYLQNKEYIQPKTKINTFDNSGVHFELFAEVAINDLKYLNLSREKHFIIECEVSYDLVKRYFGYTYSKNMIDGYFVPMPGFCIPYNKLHLVDFNINSKNSEKWLRDNVFKKYLNIIPSNLLFKIIGPFEQNFKVSNAKKFDISNFIEKNIVYKEENVDLKTKLINFLESVTNLSNTNKDKTRKIINHEYFNLSDEEIKEIHDRGNITASEKFDEFKKIGVCIGEDIIGDTSICQYYDSCEDCIKDYISHNKEYAKQEVSNKITINEKINLDELNKLLSEDETEDYQLFDSHELILKK